MYRIWADVYDSDGNRIGPGPLVNLASLRYTEMLDGPGQATVGLSGADARSFEIVQNERRLDLWLQDNTGKRLIGRMIARRIGYVDTVGGRQLRISGPDLLAELEHRNVFFGKVYNNEPVQSVVFGAVTYVDGWSVDATTVPINDLFTREFNTSSMLKILQEVVKSRGYHFRLNGVRSVLFGPLGSDSGVRIFSPVMLPGAIYDNTKIAIIESLTFEESSEVGANKVVPLGKGTGNSALTLSAANLSSPYTIQQGVDFRGRVIWFLQDDDSIATWGLREAVLKMPQVAGLSADAADQILAANELYRRASEWLERNAVKQTTYSCTVRGLKVLVRVGDKIHLNYVGPVYDRKGNMLGRRTVRDDFWILEVSHRAGLEGYAVDLTISDVDQLPFTPEDFIIEPPPDADFDDIEEEDEEEEIVETRCNLFDSSNPYIFKFDFGENVVSLTKCTVKVTTETARYINSDGNLVVSEETPASLTLKLDGTAIDGGPWLVDGGEGEFEVDITEYFTSEDLDDQHEIEVSCASGMGHVCVTADSVVVRKAPEPPEPGKVIVGADNYVAYALNAGAAATGMGWLRAHTFGTNLTVEHLAVNPFSEYITGESLTKKLGMWALLGDAATDDYNLEYSENVFGGGGADFDKIQELDDLYKLVRAFRGVQDSIMLYAPQGYEVVAGESEIGQDFDNGANLGAGVILWDNYTLVGANIIAGGRTGNCIHDTDLNDGIKPYIVFHFPAAVVLKEIRTWSNIDGTFVWDLDTYYSTSASGDDFVLYDDNDMAGGSWNESIDTGTRTGVRRIKIVFDSGTRDVKLDDILITVEDLPVPKTKVKTSVDGGENTDTTFEFGDESATAIGGADASDHEEVDIWVATSAGKFFFGPRSGGSETEIAGWALGSGYYTAALLPNRAFNVARDPATNSDPANVDVLLCASEANSGATVWARTFNSSTGAVVASADWTPVIDGFTYYCIGPKAIETWAGDPRVIRMIAAEVGTTTPLYLLTRDANTGLWTIVDEVYEGNVAVAWSPGGSGQSAFDGGDKIIRSQHPTSEGEDVTDNLADVVDSLPIAHLVVLGRSPDLRGVLLNDNDEWILNDDDIFITN
jgi:hypothetical protein